MNAGSGRQPASGFGESRCFRPGELAKRLMEWIVGKPIGSVSGVLRTDTLYRIGEKTTFSVSLSV